MNTDSGDYEISLPQKTIFSISDASGIQIDCSQGCVWITLDSDPRDIVLAGGGETFMTKQHRRALIYAIEASSIVLSPAEAPSSAGARHASPSGRRAIGSFALQAGGAAV